MIKNYKFKIKNYSLGFTLIEIMVVLGITVSLFVIVGGIITSSFRLKKGSDVAESVQNEAQVIMNELKKNIFDANISLIYCSSGVGTSISFETKSGGNTILVCNSALARVASVSAQSGTFYLNNDKVTVIDCGNFVSCEMDSSLRVTNVNFNLKIGFTNESGNSQFFNFASKVVPR